MNPLKTEIQFKPQNSQLYQDQLGYFKEFKFVQGQKQLNLLLLENLDAERLYFSGNVLEAQSCLNNFVESKISTLDIDTMTYEQYYKLFRISQLAIEHYYQKQQLKQKKIDQLYQQYLIQKEKNENIQKIQLQHEQEKQKINEKIKQLQDQIETLKKTTLEIGQFKCVYCNKTFRSKEMLSQHVTRRHTDQLNDIKAVNTLLEGENPPVKIKKLEQERKQMQEMIHLKQMQQLQRIHEREINEQKLIDQLAEKMESDLHTKLDQAFEANRNQEKEEKVMEREKIESLQIQSSVEEIKSTFGQFMDQLNSLKENYQTVSKLQQDHQKNINSIVSEQQKYNVENTQDKKKLADYRNQAEKAYKEKSEADTQLTVQYYLNDLTDVVSSQDFQNTLKQQQQQQRDKLLQEQKNALKIQNPKEQLDKDANLYYISSLQSDYDSDEEKEKEKARKLLQD